MEEKGLLRSVTKRADDNSTAKEFRFTFYCDHCGEAYLSDPIPFSVPDAPGRLEDFTDIQLLIWNAEHEDAYERANRHAQLTFLPCEICGKRVCDECNGELMDDTLCPDCRQKQ